MDQILTLLDLQKQTALAKDIPSFEFLTLNETLKLVPYKQAVFWRKTDAGIVLAGASGNVSVDQNGPYAAFLKTIIKTNLPDEPTEHIVQLSKRDMNSDEHKQSWADHMAPHGVLVVFQTLADGVMGGLWLERDKPLETKTEIPLLQELAFAMGRSYALLRLRKKASLTSPWQSMKRHNKIISIALVALCFMPVRLAVTAPAEVVAQNPRVISVPFDGVLENILVKPGETVTADQDVFVMDKTELQNQIDSAGQALSAATQKLSRLRRESLSAPEKKAEINQLRSEIAVRKIENDYAKSLMQKSDVKAGKPGVAIFSDADEFEGRPLSTGEKVMVIADPKEIEFLIRVPVDNMLPLTKESDVSFFLNVSPLSGYEGEILSMGYQASPDPDGVLSYKIRAKLAEGQDPPRIGWKGTAKIKTGWSVLIYSILRRPLITLRHVTGL